VHQLLIRSRIDFAPRIVRQSFSEARVQLFIAIRDRRRDRTFCLMTRGIHANLTCTLCPRAGGARLGRECCSDRGERGGAGR